MVSVEAHKMQAQRVIREVVPKVFKVSVKSPIEPPPEMGRINAKGRISVGKFIRDKTGDNRWDNASITPDARSIAERDKMAISGGKMETTVRSPSSTPEIKVVYVGTPFFSDKTRIKMIKMGIT